jgi:K+-transporting ATPase c subunit
LPEKGNRHENTLRPAVSLFVLLSAITGIVYPLS